MKDTIRRTILCAAACAIPALIILCGCATPQGNQAVPSSDIKVLTQFGEARFVLPKDQSVESIHYERTGSNIVADIKGLKSANNPDVVNASWIGVIAAMQQQSARIDMLFQALMFGANKAGNYFGLPATPIPGTIGSSNVFLPTPAHQ